MKILSLTTLISAGVLSLPVIAQDASTDLVVDVLELARQSGACGSAGVSSAVVGAGGTIMATCATPTPSFDPLSVGGGLAAPLGLAAAVAVVAIAAGAGGDSTSDTQ